MFRQQNTRPSRFAREQLQRQQAFRTPIPPVVANMQSRMHHQSNQSERPANRDGYRTITDGLGPIRLGANRKDNFYSDISFHQGFLPSVDFSNSLFSDLMDFRHSNATHAQFTDCGLHSARFGHAILSGAKFDGADLSKASFEGAKLGKVDKIMPLFLPIPNDTGNLFHRLFPLLTPRLSQPQTQPATFRGANLSEVNFKAAELEGCDFRDADLSNANLEDANLKDADLRGATLTGVQLEKAKSLEGAKLEGAKIDITQCIADELKADKPQVARLVITLARQSATQGIDLGLNLGPKSDQMNEALAHIFPTEGEERASQKQLEDYFRHYYKKAERIVFYRDLEPAEYLPFVFRRIQLKLAHPQVQSEGSDTE